MENTEKMMEGGYLEGNSHANGGIKIKTPEGQIEAEGGETIINKRSMESQDILICEGTPKEIASKVNEYGGGVEFAEGGNCKTVSIAEDGTQVESNMPKEDTTTFDNGGAVQEEISTKPETIETKEAKETTYTITSLYDSELSWQSSYKGIEDYIKVEGGQFDCQKDDTMAVCLRKLGLRMVANIEIPIYETDFDIHDDQTASRGTNLRSTDKDKRPSPSISATIFPVGHTMEGNDGNMWQINEDSRGIHRWGRVKAEDGLDITVEGEENFYNINGIIKTKSGIVLNVGDDVLLHNMYEVKVKSINTDTNSVIVKYPDGEEVLWGTTNIYVKKYAKGSTVNGGGVGEDKLELFYVMDNNGNIKNISKSYEKANDFLEKSLKFNGKIGYKNVLKSDWDSEKINTSNIKKYAKGSTVNGGGVGEDGLDITMDDEDISRLEKLKKEGKLKRYLDVRGNGKKVFETIIPNKSEKGMYKRYESTSQSSLGTLQNEYLDENDVLNWLKKTSPKYNKSSTVEGDNIGVEYGIGGFLAGVGLGVAGKYFYDKNKGEIGKNKKFNNGGLVEYDIEYKDEEGDTYSTGTINNYEEAKAELKRLKQEGFEITQTWKWIDGEYKGEIKETGGNIENKKFNNGGGGESEWNPNYTKCIKDIRFKDSLNFFENYTYQYENSYDNIRVFYKDGRGVTMTKDTFDKHFEIGGDYEKYFNGGGVEKENADNVLLEMNLSINNFEEKWLWYLKNDNLTVEFTLHYGWVDEEYYVGPEERMGEFLKALDYRYVALEDEDSNVVMVSKEKEKEIIKELDNIFKEYFENKDKDIEIDNVIYGERKYIYDGPIILENLKGIPEYEKGNTIKDEMTFNNSIGNAITRLTNYIATHENKIVINKSTYTIEKVTPNFIRVSGGQGATYNIVPYFPKNALNTPSPLLVPRSYYSLSRGSVKHTFAILEDGSLFDIAEEGIDVNINEPKMNSFKSTLTINNNYKGKRPFEIWDAWNEDQRKHFLKDHDIKNLDNSKIKEYTFDELPLSVKIAVRFHKNSGQYANGGIIGKRIKMIKMNDPYPVEPGTMGTVKFIDDNGQIHVNWDNGRTLAIIPRVDEYQIM